MRPEVAGAFRLALRHEATAGTLWLPRRLRSNKRATKHYKKAQKLYAKADFLAAREHVR
jgi:hypothetical protein